jgi:hypothetical protein
VISVTLAPPESRHGPSTPVTNPPQRPACSNRDTNRSNTASVDRSHTVASLLKDLHVPARDAQAILGHTRISTLEIYTDSADEAQRDALRKLDGLLDTDQN